MAQVNTTTNKVVFETNDTMALDALRSKASGLETGDLILFEKGAAIDGSSAMKIPVESFAAYAGKKITQEANAEALQMVSDIEEAEKLRVAAEQERATAETARQTAEDSRSTAETARSTAESARATAESKRATAEEARAKAESDRTTAESNRAAAETKRQTDTATAIENAEAATKEASAAADMAEHQPTVVDSYWATWDSTAQQYVKTTTEATGHSPYVSSTTLTWMVYDDEAHAYADSGVKANVELEVDTTDMCLYMTTTD